jgi:glycosyltransferase involved in cell wall biosynthesis
MRVLHVIGSGRSGLDDDPVAHLRECAPDLEVELLGFEGDLRESIGRRTADVVLATSLPLPQVLAVLRGSDESGRPCVVRGGVRLDTPATRPGSRALDSLRSAFFIAETPHHADHLTSHGVPSEHVFIIGPAADAEGADGSGDEPRARFGLRPGAVAGIVGGDAEAVAAVVQHFSRRLPEAQALHRPSLTSDERLAFYRAVDVVACMVDVPQIVVDAWAASRPVVAWRQGSLPSLVDDGLDGFLAEYRQPSALGVAIVELLENPTRARRMGEAGLSKVLTRHTRARVAEQHVQVLSVAAATGVRQ